MREAHVDARVGWDADAPRAHRQGRVVARQPIGRHHFTLISAEDSSTRRCICRQWEEKGQLHALVLLYFPFERHFFVPDLLPYPLWGLLPSRWQQSPRLPLCHWKKRRGEDGFRRSPGLEGDLGRRVFLGGGGRMGGIRVCLFLVHVARIAEIEKNIHL